MVLDSVTTSHGCNLRSADQLRASAVIILSVIVQVKSMTMSNSAFSAGPASWVTSSVVTNLVRCVEKLKSNGFWVYGADAGGTSVQEGKFADRTVLVMGSEGTGISRLLKEQCDSIVSIPTCGKIDSLNVSVATGVLLYEIYRQAL